MISGNTRPFPVPAVAGLFLSLCFPAVCSPLLPLMPSTSDYTRQWWAEGFPSRVDGAPWLRVIGTGRYGLALDTETLEVPHFGPLHRTVGYAATAGIEDGEWTTLPPAELELRLTVDGTTYRARRGAAWDRHTGPRLIESGRFFQRSDLLGIPLTADDGTRLNAEARFETSAWADRLGLLFAARPGERPFPAGERCFGKVGGGFGLDGSNHFEVPHRPELDTETFAIELRAFIPAAFASATRATPWLVCKNRNEYAEGNYGILLRGDRAVAVLNIGGGRENMVSVPASTTLRKNAWNHFVLSYDGSTMRLHHDNHLAVEELIGKTRTPGNGGLAFGRRQDDSGDGYHFLGAIDEIRFYEKPLTDPQISRRFHHPGKDLPSAVPVAQWNFQADGLPSETRPTGSWESASMTISFRSGEKEFVSSTEAPEGIAGSGGWLEAGVAIAPASLSPAPDPVVEVTAGNQETGEPLEVSQDPVRSWTRLSLDGIEPVLPPGHRDRPGRENDVMEKVRIVLKNPAETEQPVRLLFQKNRGGFRHRFGFPITGMSAILRDTDGNPTGIPVQLSKNWHHSEEAGIHSGTWFHGFSRLELPPKAEIELELVLVYGHWGGLPAASHSQLSLIGWGTNQRWDESALGSWGESICFEPDQIQGQATVTDVRPMMVRSKSGDRQWAWTNNVGGADFFRLFDAANQRIPHSAMRATYLRQGPCLTEVTYSGRIGDGLHQSTTVSLARTDDIVRGTYRIRLDVKKPVDFSRLVFFQVGADTYNMSVERTMAIGNEEGITREWTTTPGGDTYRTPPIEAAGRIPWISLHEGSPKGGESTEGAWANRGIAIRSWNAVLGGKAAVPHFAEYGSGTPPRGTSSIDLVPPPGLRQLQPGDYVEAVIEHLVLPQSAEDYYGPNAALRKALQEKADTAGMVFREAVGNDRAVSITAGSLVRTHPSLTIEADSDEAAFSVRGGLGFLPVTLTGLSSPEAGQLIVDGTVFDQSVHGNDFWQTDYDPTTRTWSRTYNLPAEGDSPLEIQFSATP